MVTDTIRVQQPEMGAETPARQFSRILPPVQDKTDGIRGTFQTPVSSVQATPKELLIGSLPDDRLRVKSAITVSIEREKDTYIARCDTLDEFGYGESPSDAIEDLKMAIVELYLTLKAEQGKLGPDMARVQKRISELVQEK
jgi:hypothetical protein